MSQSKKNSLIESITNTAIGFVISVIATFIIFWVLEIQSTPIKNVVSTGFFTAISIVRGYFVRRYFNRKQSNAEKCSYSVGDAIVVDNYGTIIDDIRWDHKLQEHHIFFKDFCGETKFIPHTRL